MEDDVAADVAHDMAADMAMMWIVVMMWLPHGC
jgi:hypothetical protein